MADPASSQVLVQQGEDGPGRCMLSKALKRFRDMANGPHSEEYGPELLGAAVPRARVGSLAWAIPPAPQACCGCRLFGSVVSPALRLPGFPLPGLFICFVFPLEN